jgi:hypothetical protein
LAFGKEEIGDRHVGSHGFKIESSFVEFSREIAHPIGSLFGDRDRAKGKGLRGVDLPPLPAISRAIAPEIETNGDRRRNRCQKTPHDFILTCKTIEF